MRRVGIFALARSVSGRLGRLCVAGGGSICDVVLALRGWSLGTSFGIASEDEPFRDNPDILDTGRVGSLVSIAMIRGCVLVKKECAVDASKF